MKALTKAQLEKLAITLDDNLLKEFPGFTRRYLREQKRLISETLKPESDLQNTIDRLGLKEKDVVDLLLKHNRPEPKIINSHLKGNKFKFGLVSDTHFGSKFSAIDELHTFYEKAKNEDCQFMLHAGDISDGAASMHAGFLYELEYIGADEQIEHIIKDYPNNGLNTYYITGNHDESHFKANGTSISKPISQSRSDLIWCGDYGGEDGRLIINDIKISLTHIGRPAYALSYPLQKYINGIEGGSKPQILLNGHLHYAEYLPYRNINALGAGCFQWQTRFLKKLGLTPTVGGWIVEVEHNKGEIIAFKPCFTQYYKTKQINIPISLGRSNIGKAK